MNAVDFVAHAASNEHDPQHFMTLNKCYVPLGIEAADLARELRRRYHLPEKTTGDWDPVEFLRARGERITKISMGSDLV